MRIPGGYCEKQLQIAKPKGAWGSLFEKHVFFGNFGEKRKVFENKRGVFCLHPTLSPPLPRATPPRERNSRCSSMSTTCASHMCDTHLQTAMGIPFTYPRERKFPTTYTHVPRTCASPMGIPFTCARAHVFTCALGKSFPNSARVTCRARDTCTLVRQPLRHLYGKSRSRPKGAHAGTACWVRALTGSRNGNAKFFRKKHEICWSYTGKYAFYGFATPYLGTQVGATHHPCYPRSHHVALVTHMGASHAPMLSQIQFCAAVSNRVRGWFTCVGWVPTHAILVA